MKRLTLLFIGFFTITFESIFSKSISDNNTYPAFCLLAAQNDAVFRTFRSNPVYRGIVETCGIYDFGVFFLNEIKCHYSHILPYLSKICAEDSFGAPISFHYPEIGTISPTVLRYVKVFGDLQREFGDLSNFDIVEIGGGFGGQCKIVNDISGFGSYTMIDIPAVTPLINKYLSHFAIKNFKTINHTDLGSPKKYDLVISNYAFSEIDRDEQMKYMESIIDLAPRGYMIYNHFPQINPLSIPEFVNLLRQRGKSVKVLHEVPIKMGDIVIWNDIN